MDENRWNALWRNLGGQTESRYSSSLYHLLVAAYGESHRRYHTSEHIEYCLKQLDLLNEEERVGPEVEAAIWFHDAVYDTHGVENEEKSARWGAEALVAGGIDERVAARVADLILETRHKGLAVDEDARIVVDVDLSILGSDENTFDRYEKLIREEYAWVPEEEYRVRRAAFLAGLLQRPVLFQTDFFRRRLEERARKNLKRSIGVIREE